ncbi:MAG: hypothetical protein ABL901_07795 [Hyphomicrobiaceae bacterium]
MGQARYQQPTPPPPPFVPHPGCADFAGVPPPPPLDTLAGALRSTVRPPPDGFDDDGHSLAVVTGADTGSGLHFKPRSTDNFRVPIIRC